MRRLRHDREGQVVLIRIGRQGVNESRAVLGNGRSPTGRHWRRVPCVKGGIGSVADKLIP